MTEPQTITVDHLRALLDAGTDTANLGLVEGRVEVITDGDATKHPGALEVISKEGLVARLGTSPTDDELAEQAASLTVAAQQIGG